MKSFRSVMHDCHKPQRKSGCDRGQNSGIPIKFQLTMTLCIYIYLVRYCMYGIYICLQVSPALLNRVRHMEQTFTKLMQMEPRISADFELSLDNHAALHSIQRLNFFQMKSNTLLILSKLNVFGLKFKDTF